MCLFLDMGHFFSKSEFYFVPGLVISVGLVTAFISSCIHTVPPGHRAVIIDRIRGVRKFVRGEGTHIYLPILQKPFYFDLRPKPTIMPESQISTFFLY